MTPNARLPRLLDVLICDDVRREDNGKLLVVGLYLDAVEVASVPTTIPSLVFVCKWAGAGSALPAGAYRVLDGSGAVLGTIETPAATLDPPRDKALIMLAFRPFTFPSVGTYRLTFTPASGRSRTLATFTVTARAA